jgi:succinoglycan biosynthesis transport protein ExoP
MRFNLLYFIRLFLKHLYLIIAVPLILGTAVFFLTKDEPRTYSSQAIVYTSLASGNSIDLTSLTFSTINTAFDNLMGIIKSRETLEEVGLRLFASHLLLDKNDPQIILPENYNELMKSIPDEIKKLKVAGNFEETYQKLYQFKKNSTNNYITNLVGKSHPYYGAGTIQGKLRVRRLQSSDNLELTFEASDPGICQNTLVFLIDVYRKAYLLQKASQSDNAVAYFESEVAKAAEKLRIAENELLSFNQENQIINYNEQSKFIAARKEQFEAGYQDVLKQNASSKAIIDLLERKMTPEDTRRIANSQLLTLRNQLAKINQDIAVGSLSTGQDLSASQKETLQNLSKKSDDLKLQMKSVVDSLYGLNNSITGVPTKSLINDWISNVIDYEGTNAQLSTLETLRNDFIKIYSQYAPMGATMRRLERKINVYEDEYISLVKNLGLSKLKQQSAEASSGGTILDPPYYPSSPLADKSKIMILAASLLGFLITIFSILVIDFLDSTMRIAPKTEAETGLMVESIFPAVINKKQKIDLEYVERKSSEVLARRLMLHSLTNKNGEKPNIIIAFSTQEQEGKSFLLQRVSEQLSIIGHKVLFLYPHQSIELTNVSFDHAQFIVSNNFYQISDIKGLVTPNFSPKWEIYDFIFVEFPGIINSSYPVNLFKTADHSFLVCRANRTWSKADANILAEVLEVTNPIKPKVLLNGVAIEEMETILGDLPRKRSRFRRLVKSLITHQSRSKSIA